MDGGTWDSLGEEFGSVGYVLFSFMICTLGLKQIVGVEEQHLIPPPPSVPMSSTALNTFAVPSISPLTRFADLSLRSPAINLLVS